MERIEADEDLVLLIQDGDFEDMPPRRGQVVVLRLSQALPIQRRVALWLEAIEAFLADRPTARILEMAPDGELRELVD